MLCVSCTRVCDPTQQWHTTKQRNQRNQHTTYNTHNTHTSYVTQDDVMMGTQTVREYLLWQTRMRLDASLTRRERHARVNRMLKEMDLEKVAASRIGDAFMRGLSGGEKRRVSIAAELITEPAVLVVDEPTSGLDSANAKGVVDALMRVARSGRVVIMSIHQPRSYIWNQFDGLMLFGRCGETLFNGPREQCLPFMQEQGFECPPDYNPADFLLDTVATLTPTQSATIEQAKCVRQGILHTPHTTHHTPRLTLTG